MVGMQTALSGVAQGRNVNHGVVAADVADFTGA